MAKSQLNINSILTNSTMYKGVSALEKSLESIEKIFTSIKTSFGPLGLDKMCIDATGDVLVTNDGATIISNMLIDDPVAKILINLALEQDKEVGDGTTSVVLLTYFLVKNGYELIKNYSLHPSAVISGYKTAFNESVKFIKGNMAKSEIDDLVITNIIKTSIASKIINEECDLFTEIVRKTATDENSPIQMSKAVGGSMGDSEFFNGFILNCSVANTLMLKRISECPVLLLEMSLMKERMPITVTINASPDDIEAIRKKEIELTREKCQFIIDSGAKLVLVTGGVDENYIKMFIANGVVCVRRVDIIDLKKIAECIGSEIHKSIIPSDEKLNLQIIDSYEVKEYGDYNLVYLEIPFKSILIRGPSRQICDEVERSLNDAMQVVLRTLKHKSIFPGGGSVEVALSVHLDKFSSTFYEKEFIGVQKYSDALKKIIKQLCLNAGIDSNRFLGELLSKVSHNLGKKEFYGLDVTTETIQENFHHGIVEPTIYKLKALKLATEASISILRINETIIFNEERANPK